MSRAVPHPILSAHVGQAQAIGGVFVCRFSLDAAHQHFPDLGSLLTDEERDRAARFVTPEHRRRAAASRALLRAQLAAFLERDPVGLVIETEPHGKPRLADGGAWFSISHSADRLVIALSRTTADLGVDVEAPQIERNVESAARFALNPDDLSALDAMPSDRRKLGFLRLWTAKEAALKAIGVGLRRSMRDVAIHPEGLKTLTAQAVWRPRGATVDGAAIALDDVSLDGDVICLARAAQAGGLNSAG